MTPDFYTNKKNPGRMDFVPNVYAIKTDRIEVDKETLDMIAALGMAELPGVVQVDPVPVRQVPFVRGVVE
ncbi:hypothetical protein TSUD_67090 [Trifolium subterraneum]|uniref:Uncharacterized protein n=1 Tax=Trifolium subterraneum TaxID=3900 RepID=A0A2Z6NSX2_TRISU|nr:hypothetical protein TSUD_67090 [Trifolium subterraneum]